MQYWLFPRRATVNLAVERRVHETARLGDRVYFLDDSGGVSLYGIVRHGEPSHPVGRTLRVRCHKVRSPVSPRRLRRLLGGRPSDRIAKLRGSAAEELAELTGRPRRTLLESIEMSIPDWDDLTELPTAVLRLAGLHTAAAEEGPRAWTVPPACQLEQRVSARNYRRIEPGARVLWQRDASTAGDWGTVLAKRSWGRKRREYRVLVTQLPLAKPIPLPLLPREEPPAGARQADPPPTPESAAAARDAVTSGPADSAVRPPARERRLSQAEVRVVRQLTTGMPSSFEEAFREELDVVAELRRRRGYHKRRIPEPVVYHQAHRAELAGLAFSGGGIRSATFNLGVLQALAERRLLPAFDYLSTVSGGGYIGSWLVAWIKRRGLPEVERELQREHPVVKRNRHLATRERRVPLTPITYLRRFSNFLTPRVGLFGPDTWTVVATYLRNLLLNLLILVLALSSLLLVPRGIVAASAFLREPGGRAWAVGLTVAALLVGLFYLFRNVVALSDFLEDSRRRRGAGAGAAPMSTVEVQLRVMLPLLIAAWAGSCSIWLWHAGEGEWASWDRLVPELLRWLPNLDAWVKWVFGAACLYLLLWLPVALFNTLGFFYRHHADWREKEFRGRALRSSWQASALWGMAFVAGLGGGLLLWWLSGALFRATSGGEQGVAIPALHGGVTLIQLPQSGFPLLVLWGPPAMVLVMVATASLHIGLMGRRFAEDHRQWWSRLGAWMLITSVGWIALFSIAIYGPVALQAVANWGTAALGTISLGWIASTLAGIWAARGADTGEGRSRWMELLAGTAPYLFVVGLLALLAAAIHKVIRVLLGERQDPTAEAIVRQHLASSWEAADLRLGALIATGVVLALGALWLSYRIDINEFSMHLLYRSRLVRAYLGASRVRRPHPFTGFDHDDDMDLDSILRPDEEPEGDGAETGADTAAGADARPPERRVYAGPLPILNTALNLSAGGDLAQQERKASSFFFTPLHYGFDSGLEPATETDRSRLLLESEPFAVRYTAAARGGSGISLGTAMTVSGAAVSPNMGYHSSAPLAFLLTVFNARLGLWLGNPRRNATWEMSGPSVGLIYLLAELFGQTSDDSRYVSLADGGFFDNLGIYELVRRRCRYIVACDAEADPELEFSGLANAIRKCRSDFGVEIDIDIEPIRAADAGHSAHHCAVGKIHYPDERARSGVLVYLKASLTGDEPEDLMGYQKISGGFPHESTGDQWFDESQFESYRVLGRHIAGEAFDAADLRAARSPGGQLGLEAVFVDLRQAWCRPSRAVQQSFTRHTTLLVDIFERLRSEENLAYLVPQVYREFREWRHGRPVVDEGEPGELAGEGAARLAGTPAELSRNQFQEGFFLCNSVIQLMENVYLDLDLEREWDHPDNRGWINLFRHWSWSWMFRLSWAISASTYGARFQKFCERRLGIPIGEVDATRIAGPPYAEPPSTLNTVELDLAQRVARACKPPSGGRLVTLPLRLSVLEPGTRRRRGSGSCRELQDLDVLFRFAFGFAVLLEVGAPAGRAPQRYLIFLRVRDHLRKLGLGRRALRFLMSEHGLRTDRPPLSESRLEEELPNYQHADVRDLLLSVGAERDVERLD